MGNKDMGKIDKKRKLSSWKAPLDPNPPENIPSLTSEVLNSPAENRHLILKSPKSPKAAYLNYFLFIQKLQQLYKSHNKIEFFNLMERKCSRKKIKTERPELLKKYDCNQFAFALIFTEHDNYYIPPVFPEHKGKNAHIRTRHSEEILIEHIEQFLYDTGIIQKVKLIFIYTENSPCFLRKDGQKCCMEILWAKVIDWKDKYEIRTEVGFTKFWGISGPEDFSSLTDSEISGSPSFQRYLDIYRNHLKLDPTLFKDTDIFRIISEADEKERPELHTCVGYAVSILKLMAPSYKTVKNHMRRFKEKIQNLEFNCKSDEIREELLRKCKEMIHRSLMEEVKKQMARDLQMLTVEYARRILGPTCPLQLHHFSVRTLDKNKDDKLVGIIRQNILAVKSGQRTDSWSANHSELTYLKKVNILN